MAEIARESGVSYTYIKRIFARLKIFQYVVKYDIPLFRKHFMTVPTNIPEDRGEFIMGYAVRSGMYQRRLRG